MDVNLFKSLPNRDRLLCILGCILDEKHAAEVLAFDSRQGYRFTILIDSLSKLPPDLKELVLLSLLNDSVLNEY